MVDTFFESDHITYEIKGNDAYNNIQAKTRALYTHSTPGTGSKGENIFSGYDHVTYRFKGMNCTTYVRRGFAHTHTIDAEVRSKVQNTLAHLSHGLKVSFCDYRMSIVRRLSISTYIHGLPTISFNNISSYTTW